MLCLLVSGTRWAPASYIWSYNNPNKWPKIHGVTVFFFDPYKWSYFILLITGFWAHLVGAHTLGSPICQARASPDARAALMNSVRAGDFIAASEEEVVFLGKQNGRYRVYK